MGSAASTINVDPSVTYDKAAAKAAVGEELFNEHGEKFFAEHASDDGTVTGAALIEFAAANGISTPAATQAFTQPEVETKFFHDLVAKMPSLEGKTIAITGTTSGTGACLADAVAKKGARVVLLNRPSERASAALAAVQAAASDPSLVTHIDCDLQSFESVRAAGAQVLALDVPLDVLVNNAGVMALADKATVDGYDVQMQTNHLSHFLLTALVWPALEKAATTNGQARVVQHSSGARRMVPALEEKYLGKNGGNLGGDAPGVGFQGARWVRYAQTKLANLGFCLALADKIAAAGPDSASAKILSLCAHPGLAATQLQVTNAADDPSMAETYKGLMAQAQSMHDGALGILRAACDPAPEIVAGTLLGPQKMTGEAVVHDPAEEQARVPPAAREMLWKASVAATGVDILSSSPPPSTYEAPEVETKFFHNLVAKMPSLEGKTIAITGTTSGTGACLADAVAKKGARVVLLNRPSERASAALAAVQAAASDPSLVTHIDCDLQSFESVRAAGAQVLALDVPLDVLVNNAGVMALADKATVDGYDVQMQTNHLSHFLLTALVWPALEKAATTNGQARVVQHSSGARRMVPALEEKYLGKNGGNLGGDAPGVGFQGARWVRYAQTKLANLGFCLALADKIAAAGPDSASAKILSLCAHPGLAATQLQVTNAADDPSMAETYKGLMAQAQSMHDGALGILRAACDPAPEIVAGTLLGPQKMTGEAVVHDPAEEQARVPPAAREMLWKASVAATGADILS